MLGLVSILIPAYNADKWISDTLKSALGQTWPKKEIIVVDDGSLDRTLQIAKGFESKTLKVVTQVNSGAGAARNKALSLAQGDYIQWLDADDLLAPDKISQQMENAERSCESKTLLSSSYGTFYFCIERAKFKPTSLWQDLIPLDWLMIKFIQSHWMNPAVWLVSRKLTELAGPWNEKLLVDIDGEYFCRVIAVSERVQFVPEAKCYYRLGNFTSIVSQTNKNLESLFLATSLSIDCMLSLEDSERTRRACLSALQILLPFFYPEKHELIYKSDELARKLGGTLQRPEINWKYYPIKKIFGWRVAKKVMNHWSKVKITAEKSWDRVLCNLLYNENRNTL